MGSGPPKFLKYFRDRKSHPNPLSLPHNFKILTYCCLLGAILYLLLIPYLLWRFIHTSGMATLWTGTCQLSAEWLRHWADSTQVNCLSGHSASQAGSAVHTGLHLCCFTVPAEAAVQVCHSYTYSWKGTAWGSEPTQIPAPPTTHSSVNVARVAPQTDGVSQIHLLCTSANISVISDTLQVCDPKITV